MTVKGDGEGEEGVKKALCMCLMSSDFQAGLLISSDVQYMTWTLKPNS